MFCLSGKAGGDHDPGEDQLNWCGLYFNSQLPPYPNPRSATAKRTLVLSWSTVYVIVYFKSAVFVCPQSELRFGGVKKCERQI